MEIGPTLSGGFGPAPLTFSEILAWQHCTGRLLQPWEALMLRKMSIEYIAFSHKAESSMCPSPYVHELTDEDRRAIAASLKASLEAV